MRPKKIPYFKMNGSGNDFIIIDNRTAQIPENELSAFISGVCRRRLSVGADGLILIESGKAADFSWRFYNSDASRAEMCGNGARCAARFAHVMGIAGTGMTFETDAGTVHAVVMDEDVKVRMPDPSDMRLDLSIPLEAGSMALSAINTGVPHTVTVCDQIDDLDVVAVGREIRRHQAFSPSGTNANFICPEGSDAIAVRTYERGVEDETLACGTGCIASALIASVKLGLSSPVPVRTRSGNFLTIHFTPTERGFEDIYLEGDACIVASGDIWPQAWR